MPTSQLSAMAPGRTVAAERVDFVILTALPEERDAVLALLDVDPQAPLDADGRACLVYYEARIATTRGDGAAYRVLVAAAGKGPEKAAAAAAELARDWQPAHVLLVGIAGGVRDKVKLGDVLIAERIADATLGQMVDDEAGRPKRVLRWQEHDVDARLLERAHLARGWRELVRAERPEPGEPTHHRGVIVSGGDVVTSRPTLAEYAEEWWNLIGVEMEGGAVSLALARAPVRPRFMMIRGVSDYADAEKYEAHTERWRAYACEVAAAYAIAFVRCGPAGPAVEPGAEGVRRVVPAPPEPRAAGLAPDGAGGLLAPERALPELAMSGDRERCLAAGANAYLTKPVGLRGLPALIERLLV